MVASLLKVISKGMQNERLQPPDDQPDLGAFQTVFLKTGRYGTQWARLDFDTMPDFNKAGIVRLVTQGELIGRIFLVTQMPDILTQQRKAYFSRKPISLFSGNYSSVNLYQGTEYLTSVNFTYKGGAFTGVQFDDLIPGGTYSLKISKSVPTAPSVPFLAVLTERPLSTTGFSLLTNSTFLLTGLTITTGSQLYAYSMNGTTWTPVNAPTGVSQGTINGIAYNGSYYISAGSCSGGIGLIAQDSSSVIAQPGNLNATLPGAISAFATNGSVIVAGGYLLPSDSGLSKFITLSYDAGLTWSFGYFSAGANTENFVTSLAWSPGLNRFLTGGAFYTISNECLGLFSLSALNDPTTWSNPSLPLTYGSTAIYSTSQAALTSLATLFTIGQPLYTWNTIFYSSFASYSSIGTLAYGSDLYTHPIFTQYNGDMIVNRGVYDLFSEILTTLSVGTPTSVTGSILGTTLTLTAGTLTAPCYITGANILRGTFVVSSISATQFIVNISQTAASNTITRYDTLTNSSLQGDYATYIGSLDANFLARLGLITNALVSLEFAASTVTTEVMTPVLAPVGKYYTAIQAIIGSSQASSTVDTLNIILSNLITPSNYNSVTIANILAAKPIQASYSSVLSYTPAGSVSFQGSITGTTLTVTSITPTYALLAIRSPVTGTGVTAGTIITGMNTTYTTTPSPDGDIPTQVFTATNLSVGPIGCTIIGTNLLITSNPNNIDLTIYQFPLRINGEGLIPGTNITSINGTQCILDTEYVGQGISLTISLEPAGSVVFSGSITNNVLTVYNASLASMVTPFRLTSASSGAFFTVLSANPITYRVNTSQTVTGTLSANVIGGLQTSLQTLSTVIATILQNQFSITDTLTVLPQLMQACDTVNSACSQAYAYYYSTILPNDNRNFGLLSFLNRQYTTTVQYTQSTTAPNLFWTGTPSGADYPVFTTYSTGYTAVQSGQVNGIAVNGSTIVMVGNFYRGKDGAKEYLGSILSSTDSGATWSLPFDPGYVSGDTVPYSAKAVLYTGYVWVATGAWASGCVTFSADGVNWSSPVSPLNETGTGYALAASPTGLLLGGSFTTAKGSTGSLSVASGNSIGFTWQGLVRPTPLLLNSVTVTRIQQNFGRYIAVGQWLSIAGTYLASIYTSTDYITWSPATLNAGITRAICYSVCADTFSWIAVGRFEGSGGSILLSDSITGSVWSNTPKGPGGLTTGTGYNCLLDGALYFIVGAWSTGVLTVAANLNVVIPPAINLTGSTGGTAFSIIVSSLNRYLLGGSFLKTNGTYGTLSTLSSVSFKNNAFTSVSTAPISPIGVNTASSVSFCKGIAVN